MNLTVFNTASVSLVFLLASLTLCGQVKIGDNPTQLSPYAVLELESTTGGLLLPRMSTEERDQNIDQEAPAGLFIFNTDENSIQYFYEMYDAQGRFIKKGWKSTTENQVSFGDHMPNNPALGDLHYDQAASALQVFDGQQWMTVSGGASAQVGNGLEVKEGVLGLGGALTRPTTLETTGANTLSITGLKESDYASGVDLLVVDKKSGELQKYPLASRSEEVAEFTATDGQKQFTTPQTISDKSIINVFRNGIRIDFTVINDNTIELEQQAVCYENDQIRIIQYN
ncbi:MAG: hypothetical protein ACON4A_08780 [Flavobacteriaceae bacterium]